MTALTDDGRGLPLHRSAANEQQLADYRGGFCHVLALTLNERHGWPVRALGVPADEYSLRPWRGLSHTPRHVYCVREDRRPVDINGVFSDEAAIRRFCAHQHNHDELLVSTGDLDPASLADELWDLGFPGFGQRELELTRRCVERLALHTLGA